MAMRAEAQENKPNQARTLQAFSYVIPINIPLGKSWGGAQGEVVGAIFHLFGGRTAESHGTGHGFREG